MKIEEIWYHPTKDNFCVYYFDAKQIYFEYQGRKVDGRKVAKVNKNIKSKTGLINSGWKFIGNA